MFDIGQNSSILHFFLKLDFVMGVVRLKSANKLHLGVISTGSVTVGTDGGVTLFPLVLVRLVDLWVLLFITRYVVLRF
jgi:hypothetical protein